MSSEQDAIEALLEKLRGGDQAALGELFARYQPQLRRMVELRLDRRLGGRVAASDVLQEAYIDAAERWRHYFEKAGMSFYV